MINHHVSKFFETLFWTGSFLIFISFFYPRWFMITITIGILLMIMATIREGFRLRRAKTVIGIVQKNEPKIIHRFILLIGVITVFIYLLLKQALVYNFLAQLYDLIKSPAIMTWWVFVLIGIIVGLFILFITIKISRIWHKKLEEPIKLKKAPKAEKAVAKKITVKIKPGFFSKLMWEEKSFWNRLIAPLLKKLEKRKARKLEEKKARLERLKKKKIEELKRKAIKEKALVKIELTKHPMLPRILITLFVLVITSIIILHKKGKFSIENQVSAAILGLLVGLFALYITVNIYKVMKERKVKEEKQEKTVLAKIKKEAVAKASKYETDLDKLYKLINEVGSLNITEVAEGFGISKEQAEEWGKILESHNLIELNYPVIGELQLCKKKSKPIE